MEPYRHRRGAAPLVVSVPHAGTELLPGVPERMTDVARTLPDTDWFVDRLYAPLVEALDATVVAATFSRYLVDANRPPDDASLYPGRATTGLFPSTTFDGAPVWREGRVPDDAEREGFRTALWRPYHARLAAELMRLEARHGAVLLWDAHSIRSEVPRLFEGTLPALNLGTAGGRSCDPALAAAALAVAREAVGEEDAVLDARFQGGHVTRGYGEPARGVHAIQLEVAQRAYMDEPRAAWDEAKAQAFRGLVEGMLRAALGALPTG